MSFDVPIEILAGPDISTWAETAQITRVEFQPGDFLVRHTKEGTRTDSWPGVHVPGWGDGAADKGEIQWTLWIVISYNGRWVTCGCIEYWPEATPSLGVHRGGDGAPFSSAARNWYYQQAGMAGRQPGPGERIGLIAVAGDQRLKDLRTVEERSPVCWVTVPAADSGVFTFDAPVPVPTPVPPAPTPVPPVVPLLPLPGLMTVLEEAVSLLEGQGKALDRLEATVATKADLAALRKDIVEAGTTIVAALSGSGASAPPNAAMAALNRLLGRRP